MRYPKFLPKGGKIGFVAPSFGCATSPYKEGFKAGLNMFEGLGYKTVLGPNSTLANGIGKSNTPELCGAEINDFFINNRCDVIVSCGGGETMCEDLPYIDFEGIKKAEPKWYLGYSDNTNLTFLLPTLCDTAALYGPCASEFGMSPLHPAVKDAFDVLKGEKLSFSNYDGWESTPLKDEAHPYAPYNITESYHHILAGDQRSAGSFSGRFIGGCMDILFLLAGTKYDKVNEFIERYKDDGIVWFLESCELNVMDVRRVLWKLDELGWFRHVKGFLIGRPMMYKDEFIGYTMHDAFRDMLSKYGVPILMDIDLGHIPPQMPFISGAYGNVRADEKTLVIDYELR